VRKASGEKNQKNAKHIPCNVTDYAKYCPSGSCLWEVKPDFQKMNSRFSITAFETSSTGIMRR